MSIIRKAELRVTAYGFLSCLSGESGSEMRSWEKDVASGSNTQFCSPDDGHKDARNMLRNN